VGLQKSLGGTDKQRVVENRAVVIQLVKIFSQWDPAGEDPVGEDS
jgi:hypothetical protein